MVIIVGRISLFEMLNNGYKDNNDNYRNIRISKLNIIKDENYYYYFFFRIMNGIEFDHGKL